jgi:hypothetical protein
MGLTLRFCYPLNSTLPQLFCPTLWVYPNKELILEHVLVTGGAGYVGSGLLRDLLFQGYSVTRVDNLMFGGESLLDIWHNEDFNYIKCDVNDWVAFNNILSNNKFDKDRWK